MHAYIHGYSHINGSHFHQRRKLMKVANFFLRGSNELGWFVLTTPRGSSESDIVRGFAQTAGGFKVHSNPLKY